MVATSLFFASIFAFAAAKPSKRNFVVHDSRAAVPSSFVQDGAAPSSQIINFRIGLTQRNITGLHDVLYDISDPVSANYGAHLAPLQLNDFLSPTEATVDAVTEWLTENGLTSQTASPSGDWITVSTTVGQANKLLNTQFETFTHIASGKQITRTLSYSLPSDLIQHVDVIHPTTSFDKPVHSGPVLSTPLIKRSVKHRAVADRAVPASCSSTITPTCLQDLYGIPTTPATESSNQIGVSGFIDQWPQKSDLTTFLKDLRTDLSSSTTFTLQTLDGGSDPQSKADAGIEANLDVQYTIGVATDVPVVFVSVGENTQDGDLGGFLDIINFLSGESTRPAVLTTSYGDNENEISITLADRLCNAYASIGALGTSILFASGDGGVAGGQSTSCTDFLVAFPSGCPFMTSVGATSGVPETSASFSSGGFSNYFGQPSYQASAVSTFLTTLGSTDSGKFNRSGRGYPDVSAQGVDVEIVSGGTAELVDGTSCSSPIFASVIGLINDRLVAAGKPVLGFLNPFLYANPSAFNDITTGHNTGCNTNGFPAVAGWDPVTGLGTPNFAALLAAAGV